MKDFFSQYLSDPRWLIYDKGWNPYLQTVSETQLALGNGYIGSRGILEEIPPGCEPGTFFSGLYDKIAAQVAELVNAPNPINFKVIASGEKLDVGAMNIVSHKRTLDLRQGLLARQTVYANARKERFDYQSIRFFSLHNKHIAVMQVYLTPLDAPADLTIENLVETATTNKGLVTEGRKKHFHVTEILKKGNINYLCVKTLEKEILVAYASNVFAQTNNKNRWVPYRTFYLNLKKGETACITKFFSFYTSREVNPKRIKAQTIQTLRKTTRKGFKKLLDEHCKTWVNKWKTADIQIEGDANVERTLRFNTYHLLISSNDEDNDASIGARGLIGEGYRGHIFWDTEIFILPFFIYTNPRIARNLLLYRHRRLNMARKIAAGRGYQGAMFPWESADSGEECTPPWYRDSDGVVREVLTGQQEHHITADIAYGVCHYFTVTNDWDFMLKYGLEIMIETARFWASRVEYNKKKKRYDINRVIGPDEFHDDVNNNAYTNALAQWNLIMARKIHRILERKSPATVKKLMKKINLSAEEMEKWPKIAGKIYMPIPKRTGIIEQFEGFFKKKKLRRLERDDNFIPIVPNSITFQDNIYRTQFIKQADVVMLSYLLEDILNAKQKKKNYLYYEKRTLHQSSLSPSMHSIVGSAVGERKKAYRYFLTAAYTDLKNIYGNTAEGIHTATLGGTWQAVINGFAGLGIKKKVLSFNPKLPAHWDKINFSIKWRGFNLSVNVGQDKIKLYFASERKKDWLPVEIYGTRQRISANKSMVFCKKSGLKKYYPPETKGGN